MKRKIVENLGVLFLGLFSITMISSPSQAEKADNYQMTPPFLTNQEPPLVMLVMDKSHKLYYEAYNDASDLNQDGGLDVGYKGEAEAYTDSNGNKQYDRGEAFVDANGNGVRDAGEAFTDTDKDGVYDGPEPFVDDNNDGKWNESIDYYGYFDSYKCYTYSTTNKRFEPTHAYKNASNVPIKQCAGAAEWSGDFLNYVTMSRMDTMRKVLYGGYRVVDTAKKNSKWDSDETYTDTNGNGKYDSGESYTDIGQADTLTVLQRAFIPQDAHSWGKEYQSVARDGYDIRDYTPLDLPLAGKRHLFASTTEDANDNRDGSDDPTLMRVWQNSNLRIWEWVATESPVAYTPSIGMTTTVNKTDAIDDHAEFEQTVIDRQSTHPESLQGTISLPSIDQASTSNANPKMTDPDNYYIAIFNNTFHVANRTNYGHDFIFGVDGDDAVEVIIRHVPTAGNAGKLINISGLYGDFVYGRYGANGAAGSYASSPSVNLPNGDYQIEFRFHEIAGNEAWKLGFKRIHNSNWNDAWELVNNSANSANRTTSATGWTINFYNLLTTVGPSGDFSNYEVKVVVCDPNMPEANCKQYPDGTFKPIGLLQRYGESDTMMFGLMSGSYAKNTQGGVLRKNISSINNEIRASSGVFKVPADGNIIDNINRFRIVDFRYSGDFSKQDIANSAGGQGGNYINCGWITTRSMNDTGECANWGNPIGEMMYESLRYFAGRKAPTPAFSYLATDTNHDNSLGLSMPPWANPYLKEDVNKNGKIDVGEDTNLVNGKEDGFEPCSKPFMLVLSDIYPSYDSNQLPGAYSFPNAPPVTGTNPANEPAFAGDPALAAGNDNLSVDYFSDLIFTEEGIAGDHFIGSHNSLYDGACTAKTVSDLGEIRGLCPEEPTKKGSYYAAAVAYYGKQYDINATAKGNQNVTTMAVALASPLPKINIKAGSGTITLIPFAKTIADYGTLNRAEGQFQPTMTIVDFFVDQITETHGVFRVNFEDVEQGADHDQDTIVEYTYDVTDGNKVTIKVKALYSSMGYRAHLGYIISGTASKNVSGIDYPQDGIYLEIRDISHDQNSDKDYDYFLDTPDECIAKNQPANCWNNTDASDIGLPSEHTRIFYPGTTPPATLINDPLYYAAKWGGFVEAKVEDGGTPTEDVNGDGELTGTEDKNGNGAIDYRDATGPVHPKPDIHSEWDADGDGIPDSYFYVVNPLKLEEQLNKSFSEILRRSSSGAAASVISNSRSGEGAVYQSIFFPQLKIGNDTISWIGEVHALFTDSHGNMREDTNGNKQLNIHNEDLNKNGVIDHHLNEDVNGNNKLDANEDLNHNGRLDTNIDEDLDGDGIVDTRDLIIRFDGQDVYKIDDVDEDEVIDDEEHIAFVPDIPSWHGSGVNGGVPQTEDTNGNGKLDPGEDLNKNGILDFEDQNGDGLLTIEPVYGPFSLTTTDPAQKIRFVWSATDWLNSSWLNPLALVDAHFQIPRTLDPITQRVYTQADDKRYIFTFVDQNLNGVVDSGEQVPFVNSNPETLSDPQINPAGQKAVPAAELTDPSKFFPYLTLYPSFADKPGWVTSLGGYKTKFEQIQANRVVEFIRGKDQSDHLVINGVNVPDMRNRSFYDTPEGKYKTWRLGDVVHSSPTVVGRPQESYNLLYRDKTYAEFLARYQNRRSVIYTGGNDGMIHAFNGGFFDAETASFLTSLGEPFTDLNGDGNYDDSGEAATWTDSNHDGNFDGDINEPYTDSDGDGHYDKKEAFTDVDGDGHHDDGETFTDGSNNRPLDGVFNPGDSYTDTDGDCHYDATEPFSDTDHDGHFDAEEEPYTDVMNGHRDPGESYVDGSNGFPLDGHYQHGETFHDGYNHTYDVGEAYTDGSNSNPVDGQYNAGEDFTDTNGNFVWDAAEPFVDGSNGFPLNSTYDVGEDFTDTNGNSVWDAAEPFVDGSNGYPADSAYNIGETFTDTDGDKVRDAPELYFDTDGDGHHDMAESYTDIDGDGKWDSGETYSDDNHDNMYTPPEAFVDTDKDCHFDSAEPYTDTDLDLRYDSGEPFIDYNKNGRYDGKEWFDDLNSNGVYDAGEPYIDLDGDGHFDLPDAYTDIDNDGHFDPIAEPFVDRNNNGKYDKATQTAYALGSELWAYIPYNLLPHLYWLTEASYPHVYYNDLQPKVFDAKIFFGADGKALDAGVTVDGKTYANGYQYPYGWGTVMVVGMRLGGGSIRADMDRNDTVDATDRTMTSAYVVFDITNPEAEPRVLAEISLDKMGYTTCYPAVIPMRPRLIGNKTAADWNTGLNDWYLVFGSGPADSSGVAAHKGSVDNTILTQAISKQTGKLFVVDLKKLTQATSPVISSINESGDPIDRDDNVATNHYIQALEANSFVSQPIVVDYNLDFKADTVYFGTISGSESAGWAGRMRRLLVDNEPANNTGKVNWTGSNTFGYDRADNTMLDLASFTVPVTLQVLNGQPISAAPTATLGERVLTDVNNDTKVNDFDRERWVFFGTGRFYVRDDAKNTDQQSYYGIKEPVQGGKFSGGPVTRGPASLLNVTDVQTFDETEVAGVRVAKVESTILSNVHNWDDLLGEIDDHNGWYQDFSEPKERNLGQAVLLGELLTFSTYVPAQDACAFEGESWLSALFYRTGTAYYEPAIGFTWRDNGNTIFEEGEKMMTKKVNLGRGLALSPNVHTGREAGSRAYIQTSTGAIETVDQINPGMTKSGKTSWLLR